MDQITLIQPKRRLSPLEWKEVAEYRDLLYYLSMREIKLRYKQTSLGIVWVVLQPLVPAIIFAVLFALLFALLFAISELLASIPGIAANSIFQAIKSGISWLVAKFPKKV
jgi:ABC-type polysaccharide/polyol phosphate export permease